jgi:hypothetical protein
VVRGEAANINFIVFGLTWSGLEHTIYDTPDDKHYTTNEVNFTAFRGKSKDLLARNQDNVSEWGNMSIRGMLFQ